MTNKSHLIYDAILVAKTARNSKIDNSIPLPYGSSLSATCTECAINIVMESKLKNQLIALWLLGIIGFAGPGYSADEKGAEDPFEEFLNHGVGAENDWGDGEDYWVEYNGINIQRPEPQNFAPAGPPGGPDPWRSEAPEDFTFLRYQQTKKPSKKLSPAEDARALPLEEVKGHEDPVEADEDEDFARAIKQSL
ncbi:MAG: hypothetical protein ACREGC_04010, partial [Minisyncoccia bacterium]